MTGHANVDESRIIYRFGENPDEHVNAGKLECWRTDFGAIFSFHHPPLEVVNHNFLDGSLRAEIGFENKLLVSLIGELPFRHFLLFSYL